MQFDLLTYKNLKEVQHMDVMLDYTHEPISNKTDMDTVV